MDVDREALERFFGAMSLVLDERQRRLQAGAMARLLGRGGQARVTEASGMSRNTVIAGTREIATGVGAVVVYESNQLKAVGVEFGRSTYNMYYMPVGAVLNDFGLSLVTG